MFFRPRLFDSFSGYSRALFTKDVFAGMTVGIVALPLAMAFAIASGLKPQAYKLADRPAPSSSLFTALWSAMVFPIYYSQPPCQEYFYF